MSNSIIIIIPACFLPHNVTIFTIAHPYIITHEALVIHYLSDLYQTYTALSSTNSP